MVSTRNHPKAFPPPDVAVAQKDGSPTKSPTKRGRKSTSPDDSSNASGWTHTPSNLTILWLSVSLPLVIWDTVYVLFRPHTMPGGKLHWPIYVPYKLYGTIDHVYGWPAYESGSGFPAAQGALNAIETLMYLYYLAIVVRYGAQSDAQGTGAPDKGLIGKLGMSRELSGRKAAEAALIGFSAAIMTVSKTVLYGLNEALSGFHSIGHNDLFSLVFLWIIPNGLWLVFPSYLIYVLGSEILDGLDNEPPSSALVKKSK